MAETHYETSAITPKKDNGVWITDGAWISGFAGVIALFFVAIICHQNRWLENGLVVLGIEFKTKLDVELFCLILIACFMCLVEFLRLTLFGHKPLFSIAPSLSKGQSLDIVLKSFWRYLCYLALFNAVIIIYKVAPEYGFIERSNYYMPWFKMCGWLLTVFTWLGFPYVLLTYALKYDEQKDKNSYHKLVEYIIFGLLARLKIIQRPVEEINKSQRKKILLGLGVRAFFAPLMTVFFIDQFGHLVSNFGYVFDSLPKNIASGNYNHATFNQDLMNLFKPIIFSIDVTLAWCGYVITSRWLDNETQSAEPTLLGWLVCLISYPPFQLAGLYFLFPSESQIHNLDNHYFVTFFTVLTLLSFIIYTISTIVFGVRFSNLTHRGIIRTGPFAIIRHPAYTSKNIGWWLGIFPVLLYLFFTGTLQFIPMLLMTLALLAQSYWYYLRAITEEQHLLIDPAYKEYCENVKYRFIPGIL